MERETDKEQERFVPRRKETPEGERYLVYYKIPKCGQRCSRAYQAGTNFRVTKVEVYLLHNGVVAGRSGAIDQGNANMADYRSDLTDAAEQAIVDADMEDLEPHDNFGPSTIDVLDEMIHNLSSVFPEVEREANNITMLLVYEKECPEGGCTCVWEGELGARNEASRRSRTKTYQRIVPVGVSTPIRSCGRSPTMAGTGSGSSASASSSSSHRLTCPRLTTRRA